MKIPDDLREMFEDAKMGAFYPSYSDEDVVALIERVARAEAERDEATEKFKRTWTSDQEIRISTHEFQKSLIAEQAERIKWLENAADGPTLPKKSSTKQSMKAGWYDNERS